MIMRAARTQLRGSHFKLYLAGETSLYYRNKELFAIYTWPIAIDIAVIQFENTKKPVEKQVRFTYG